MRTHPHVGRRGLLGAVCASMIVAGVQTPAAAVQTPEPVPHAPPPASLDSAACRRLSEARIGGGAAIAAAELIRKDEALASGLGGPVAAPVDICRVRVTAAPTPGSQVRIEIWMPAQWNGRMVGIGGGGLNGGLGGTGAELAAEVARGYAGVINDAGHEMSASARWAFEQPERVIDFGHRGDHVAAEAGREIISAFYGRPPEHRYFMGCSGGGREALMLAERYPADYDGILAGAPAANFTGLMTSAVWNSQRVHRMPEARDFPAKLGLLRDAVTRQCDRLDGVADGVIENPLACRFDPASIQCRPGQAQSECLTPGEVAVAREIYRGPRTSAGERVAVGHPPGSESDAANPGLGWGPFITENGIGALLLGGEFFRWIVYQDPQWSLAAADLDRDFATARSRVGATVDAQPDLSAFVRRGGRLLIYQGWEDAAVPAGNTIAYHDALRRAVGAAADRSVRLFMMPGVAHCNGGPGPGVFDRLATLHQWVATGQAPERIVAAKYEDDARALRGLATPLVRTRPLCPWPKVARYDGSGSTDDAASFTCARPRGSGTLSLGRRPPARADRATSLPAARGGPGGHVAHGA